MSTYRWRKSSYTGPNGNCVELSWRKSSYTGTNGDCVELCGSLAHIRDSKAPDGPVLRGDVVALIRHVKLGQLGR